MRSRKWLIFLLAIVIVMSLATYAGVTNSYFLDQEDSSDDELCTITNWYHLAWHWRKPLTISNSGGALSDYQVKVTINTQELISAGKMQPDGDDIRFTTSDGTTETPYWIESGINTTATIIWVRVPSIPNGDSTIYIYYKNDSAGAVTSVPATFDSGSFQDLFDDISTLDTAGSSGVAVTAGEAQLIVDDTEILDVNQVLAASGVEVYDQQWVGQTFYTSLDGFLTKVTIRVDKQGSPPNALEVQIRNASGNEPGTIIYATSSRDDITTLGNYDFTFNLAAAVTAGTQYAVVTKTIGGDASNYYYARFNPNVYPGGRAVLSTNNGSSWTGFDAYDYYCKTYVTTSAELDQSQIASSANWATYGTNWGAQSFVAGESGDLTMVVINAAAIGSPPSALTVEVQDAEESILEVVGQSQTSYSGNRQVYGSRWRAQTFRAGSSGDLSKVTLRATKNGSPPNALTVQLRNVTTGSSESEDQNQTAYTGDRQVYGDNWRAQIFQTGTSGSLSKVTLRATKNGSPPNALTVQLRDIIPSYQENEDQSQTSYTAGVNIYDTQWVGQTFQAGASGTLTKLTLGLARTENEDQSQTAYTGDRQVYGNNWAAQIFQAGISDSLSKITLRAAENGSPPNALTMELRDIIPSYQENEDQSQTAYTGDRQVYGSNWAAQIFQAGASGSLTKATLRAALIESGSPPGDLTIELRNTIQDEVLDQSQTNYDSNYAIYSNIWVGQTFQAGATGELTKVTITTSKVGSPPALEVQIRDASGDLPGSTIYATASRSDIGAVGQYDFIFSTPANVTSGTQYAIVIKTTDGDGSNNYPTVYQTVNPYAAGRACASIDSGGSWTGYANLDTYFQTYVTVSAHIPGSTVYATASRSDITTAGEYDFTYASPYSITSGTRYALVIYTSAGDASNYYNVSYQNTNAYANGRECSSANGGTDWTGSDTTDLYFRTKMGVALGAVDIQIRNCTVDDLPGTTVYASTSKEPEEIGTSFATYDFTFTTPASVIAGVKYSIVIKTDSGDANNNYPFYYETADVYASGRACLSTDSSGSWDGFTVDSYFQTYVTASAYTPGSTVYATASRSDITTAGEYDFTYASPYSITSGTRYALVIYTSAGDASNYYNVSYQNSDAYANGRECSSVNGGTDWTGSDTTDLYFRTYVTVVVGNTPGSTVYATASRSDITTAGEYDFVFASPYSITAEANYALVIYTSGGSAVNYYGISYQNSNAYGLGKECSSSNGGGSWTPNDTADLYFKTYISSATGKYQPGGTVYASASRSNIGTSAQDQVFFFATPATITSGTRYTIVVKTSGGDASNYYNVSYQSVNAYASGDRSYSADSGTIWMMTDHDLWFKTYVEFDRAVSASGTVRSAAIPTAGDARFAVGVQLSWNDTEQANSDIKYQMEYYTGSTWSLIPDDDLEYNSTGFDDSPLDISSLLTNYERIRLVANMSSTYSTDTPSVQDWTATYYYRQYSTLEPGVSGIGDEE